MPETPFIVTIDTEGDDLWAKPREITTRNAAYLPRFQALCERFGFKPVYLTNYEMAMSEAFVEFGRDVLQRGAGEIGMHLHAWNSPPLFSLTDDDFCPALPDRVPYWVMRENIRCMTRLLGRLRAALHTTAPSAGVRPPRYARCGTTMVRVDGSSPGVAWRPHPAIPSCGASDSAPFRAPDSSRRAAGGR